jgi:hypothetical protein
MQLTISTQLQKTEQQQQQVVSLTTTAAYSLQ